MAHWLKMKPEEKKLNTKPQPQKWCTQEERQEAYDNWETTDDHQRKMLEEILRLQTDKTGQRPYRLSREGFDLAIDILLPPDISKKKSIRYEDFVK